MKMEFFAIKTPLITDSQTSVAEILLESVNTQGIQLMDFDVFIIASKIISVCEGLKIPINDINDIRKEAFILAERAHMKAEVVEMVFREADLVIGAVPGAILALKDGVLQANAGVDQSNAGGEGFLILLPRNPIQTARQIRKELNTLTGKKFGVIIADSKTHPLRRGTSGFALGVSGFTPVIDDRGTFDLYKRQMRITTRAIADNLVCGAQILMGESNQSIPLVIARGCEKKIFTDDINQIELNSLMKMNPEDCIYIGPFWPLIDKLLDKYKKIE